MTLRASRFAVVDDEPEHADLVRNAIALLGRPCHTVYYNAEVEIKKELHGVRVLFLDLHLLTGIVSSDKNKEYSVLADLLISGITIDSGPFIVILWTRDPEFHDEFQKYIVDHLDGYDHARPVKVLCLAKEEYLLDMDPKEISIKLGKAIEDTLKQVPQVAALLAWEDDVHRAANSTLAQLLNLVPSKGQSIEKYNADMNLLISRLSVEAVGHKNVPSEPRSALTTALTPILFDQMHNLHAVASDEWIWSNAITRSGEVNKNKASLTEAGKVNAMLHVAYAPTVAPTDMGAVVDLPEGFKGEEAFELQFGLKPNKAKYDEYFVKGKENIPKCSWRLIRIGAACDQAQPKESPISYLLALEVPKDVIRWEIEAGKTRPAEWVSPVFETPDQQQYYKLVANSRYVVTFTRAQVASWKVLYRLREQLLTQLVGHVMQYNARPGIVALQAPEEVLIGGSGAGIAVANDEPHALAVNVEKESGKLEAKITSFWERIKKLFST